MRFAIAMLTLLAAQGAQANCGVPAGSLSWSDGATWNGAAGPTWTHPHIASTPTTPPQDACVVIPANTSVELDDDATIGGMTVSGELSFSCAADRRLTAHWIDVSATGTLRIGTELDPFTADAEVEFSPPRGRAAVCGKPSHVSDVGFGHPLTLRVVGGTLDLHGKPRSHSWTTLDSHAFPMAVASTLDVRGELDWRGGETIVVASTDYDIHQTEERRILSRTTVHGTGLSELVVPGLAYGHYAGTYGPALQNIAMRAEVALLDRNVRITTHPLVAGGGQVRITDGGAGVPTARISWTEFTRMGNTNVMGEYPLHFHFAGNVGSTGSYVTNSALHHNRFRSLTVHQTDGLRLEHNVSYDTLGHAYYFEDGVEKDNTLIGNLALLTRAIMPPMLVASDAQPGGFYLRHPLNELSGNVAAASEGHGFYFDTPDYSEYDQAGNLPLMAPFTDNIAHSNARKGFFLDFSFRTDPATVMTAIERFSSWRNSEDGIWLRMRGTAVLNELSLADNRTGAYLASGGWQDPDDSRITLRNSLIVGNSNNAGHLDSQVEMEAGTSLPDAHPQLEGPVSIIGVDIYDGHVTVEDSTFAAFRDVLLSSGETLHRAAFSQVQKHQRWAVDPRNRARGLTFVDANRLWFRDPAVAESGAASTVLVDEDGSITGGDPAWLIPNVDFAHPNAAGGLPVTELDPITGESWNAHALDYADHAYAQVQLSSLVPGCTPLQLAVVASGARGVLPVTAPNNDDDRFGFNVLTRDSSGMAPTYDVAAIGCTPNRWRLRFRSSLPGETTQLRLQMNPGPAPAISYECADPMACVVPQGAWDAVSGVLTMDVTIGGAGLGLLDGEQLRIDIQ